jgi:putative transposase
MMARLPRLNIPNIPQHVIQRGNNRQVCFFAEQDYTVYLNKLGHYASKLAVRINIGVRTRLNKYRGQNKVK